MPDEKAVAAVADAPETPVGPTEVPVLPDQETEVTEPQAPQEPSEEVSGPEPGEETSEEQPTDPLEALIATFRESLGADPELAKRVLDELPQELRDSLKGPEADKSEWEATSARKARLEAASTATSAYSGQNLAQRAASWADTLAASVRGAAQGLLDSHEGSVDLIDTQKVAGEIAGEVVSATSAYWHWGTQSVASGVFDVLEKSGAHKFLSADDRSALKAGANKPDGERAAEAVALHLAAAERAAPEAITKAATEKAEKAAGLVTSRQKLRDALPRNGKRPGLAPPPAATPKDEQEARNWNAEGKWSAAQLRAWINSQ